MVQHQKNNSTSHTSTIQTCLPDIASTTNGVKLVQTEEKHLTTKQEEGVVLHQQVAEEVQRRVPGKNLLVSEPFWHGFQALQSTPRMVWLFLEKHVGYSKVRFVTFNVLEW